MEIKPAKKWYLIGRLSLFMAGPVIAFTYSHLPLFFGDGLLLNNASCSLAISFSRRHI